MVLRPFCRGLVTNADVTEGRSLSSSERMLKTGPLLLVGYLVTDTSESSCQCDLVVQNLPS